MLNPTTGQRELAYFVVIEDIRPIEGYDRVEYAKVGGWWVIVRKNQFKVGDIAIYIEIDSKVPSTNPAFEFLEKRNYKVKTLKMCKVISQGLLMSPSDFGWEEGTEQFAGNIPYVVINGKHETIGFFLTELLGITYADAEDNQRKAPSVDKYKKMAARHPNVFKKPWAKWLMRREWGKKLMFLFFGKKKDKRGAWPEWVKKTDEERCQNLGALYDAYRSERWMVTEKIDGSSCTATYRKGTKYGYYICSRNVVFDKPDKQCYYDTNIYVEMSEKYDFERILKDIVKKYNLEWATLQGEVYGDKVQKRDYGLTGHDFMGFNLIFSDRGRLDSWESRKIMAEYGVPWVPILYAEYELPPTVEQLLDYAAKDNSAVDGGMREGIVLRSLDGQRSFKAVSNEFLLKYHQ